MNRVLRKSWFNFDVNEEIREIIILSIIALLVPLFFGKIISLIFGEFSLIASNVEIIIGTIINSLLIVCALNIKGFKKIVPVIILPSVGWILSNYLFGGAVSSFLWMIPFIWIGNFAFIYIFKWLMVEKKMNYFLTGLIAVIVKVLIIYGIFCLLNLFGVFPSIMLNTLRYTMGALQGFTGILGVFLGFLIYTSYRYV